MTSAIKYINNLCDKRFSKVKNERGYSLLELLIVVTIISVMSSFAVFQYVGNKKAYATEFEAFKIINMLRNASQRAISQKQVMRVEIDVDDNVLRLIDEESVEATSPDPHTNDFVVTTQPLDDNLRIIKASDKSEPPTGITTTPNSAIGPANFARSTNPLSLNKKVWVARFLSNGTVVNETGVSPTSATIYVWQPASDVNATDTPQLVRAITLFGSSGAVRYWVYDGNTFIER